MLAVGKGDPIRATNYDGSGDLKYLLSKTLTSLTINLTSPISAQSTQ